MLDCYCSASACKFCLSISSDETTCRMAGPTTSGQPYPTISQSEFSQLMQMIESAQAMMEEKFPVFQAEVWQGQEEAASKPYNGHIMRSVTASSEGQ